MTKPRRKKRTKTETTGVYALGEGRWKIKVTARDPMTKTRVARQRLIEAGSLEEAVRARDEMHEELTRELLGLPSTKKKAVTVADYAEQWIEEKAARLRPGVAEHYLDVLGKRILPPLGEIPFEELTRGHVARWVAWAEAQTSSRGQQFAHDTLHSWWRVLAGFLRDGAAEFDIADPTRRVRPPRSEIRNVSELRALSAEQLKQLLVMVKRLYPRWYAEVYTMAFTGMRPSELYALKWEDVELEKKLITIRRSLDKTGAVNATKTGSPRQAAITDTMVQVLTEHRRTMLREQHEGLRSGLVFPTAGGGHRKSSSLKNVLELCRSAAKLEVKVGPKTLRKTFITLAALSGHDRLAIRANVGHCDEEMTERYAWVSPEEKLKVVKALEDLVDEDDE